MLSGGESAGDFPFPLPRDGPVALRRSEGRTQWPFLTGPSPLAFPSMIIVHGDEKVYLFCKPPC